MQTDALELSNTRILRRQAGRTYRIVRRDMRVLVRVGGDILAVVEGICVFAGARGRADVEDSVV
jgi:hypothetical protein